MWCLHHSSAAMVSGCGSYGERLWLLEAKGSKFLAAQQNQSKLRLIVPTAGPLYPHTLQFAYGD